MALEAHEQFAGKKVHVIGLGRSGVASADILMCLGAIVTVHDNKHAWQLEDALNKMRRMGLDAKTGEHAYEGIANADLVVTSPGVPRDCPGIVAAIEKGISVISEIELAYRISPAPIIGITGTNGKSTTSGLIAGILKAQGREAFLAGNILAGEIRLPLVRAAFRASASDVLVGEISSFQLEWIKDFHPKVSALLNISTDHLDRHPSMEDYVETKMRIFENQGPEDHAVLNADDPAVMELAPRIKSKKWLFSRKGEVEMGTLARGTEVWSRTPSGDERVCDASTMRLRGLHNLENVLAAVAAVMAFCGDTSHVQQGIDEFEPLAHRLEPVAEINGVEFLNNSMCTNIAAAVRSLESIGRPLIVIGGGKGKGDDYTPLGEAFKKYAKHVILIGEDAALIAEAARNVEYDRISHALSMEEAVETAWRHAKPGDTIMLSPSGSSYDMFVNFEQRGEVFKDAVRVLATRFGTAK